MTGKKHLWIPLTLMLLASIAMVSVPVQSPPPPPEPEPEETRLYIKDYLITYPGPRQSPPPDGYIPGVSVGGNVWAIVDIETPSAWDNTSTGIVGWTFSVHVNPAVLEPLTVIGAKSGWFLYDYIDLNNISLTDHPPKLVKEPANKTTGDIKGIGELILGYKTLGVGAGGNSNTSSTYGALYGLVLLRFRSKSLTEFTRIEISNASWVDVNGDKHPFDVIDNGRYNEPDYHYLSVESTPTDGIDFTIDTTTYTTNATDIKLEEGNYIVTMPDSWMVGTDQYRFREWNSSSNNPVRAISLFANDTITATYEHREAGLVGRSAWPEHHHFDISKDGNDTTSDRHGTLGNQTLYAKVKNLGEVGVTVKVVFEVVKGTKIVIETDNVTNLAPEDPAVILTGNFTGYGTWPYDDADIGKWKVTATSWCYNPYTDTWALGAKTKTVSFAVVA